MLCVRLPHIIVRSYLLLNEINTRYGWGANPYPTGTFTPQDTPGFAQRDNDKLSRAVFCVGWSVLCTPGMGMN